MKKKDSHVFTFTNVSFAIIMIAIVIAFFAATFFIRQSRNQNGQVVDAAFVPRLVILGIAACSAMILYGDIRNGKSAIDDYKSLKPIALCVLIMLIFIILLDYIGFILGGFCFMFSTMFLVDKEEKEKRKVMVLAAISFVCALFFTLVFRYGFNIGIPVLPFGL